MTAHAFNHPQRLADIRRLFVRAAVQDYLKNRCAELIRLGVTDHENPVPHLRVRYRAEIERLRRMDRFASYAKAVRVRHALIAERYLNRLALLIVREGA